MDGMFEEGAEILGLGGERARECLHIELNRRPFSARCRRFHEV